MNIAIAAGDDYPEEITDQDIARFCAQAEDCRQQAERAINPLDKERWLRRAGDWTTIAQEAEKWLGK